MLSGKPKAAHTPHRTRTSLDKAYPSAAYQGRLRSGRLRFVDYLALVGLGLSDVGRSSRRLDQCLEDFVQHCYNQGFNRGEAVESVLAVQRHFRRRGQLPVSWERLKSWEMLLPPRTRVPITKYVLDAVWVVALALAVRQPGPQAWPWMVAATLWQVGFSGLLRPKEMWGLKRQDIVLPTDLLDSSSCCAVLVIQQPKNKMYMGRRHFALT